MAVPPPPPPPPRPPRAPERGQAPRGRTGRPDGGWPRWVMWLLLAVVAAVILLPFLLPGDDRESVPYNEFMVQVREGNVASIDVNNDTSGIKGTFSNGEKFSTTAPARIPDADLETIQEFVADADFETLQAN